jgi:beta-galactosidase/beta-glucuronidase
MNNVLRRIMRRLVPILSVLVSALSAHAADTDWRPAPSPLKTRWAKDVTAEKARPEYPRPQFVRSLWQNLNGLWEFAFDDGDRGRQEGWSSGKTLPSKILVPWTFEASLSGIGKGQEVHEHVWYRRTFELPSTWKGKDVLLHFGAVDWESTVWVNGHEVGTHRGGYTPFTCDISKALRPDGPQEIVVAVYDPADPKKAAFQPKGKQLGSHSIWYTRTTGIWQTVWVEPVARTHFTSVVLEPDLSQQRLTIKTRVTAGVGESVHVSVSKDGKAISDKEAMTDGGAATLTVDVKDPSPWSPESPALYDVVLTLQKDGTVLDELKSYTAFRTVDIKDQRIRLNGQPYFFRGVLDQGFWPDGIYTPPTDDAIKYDVEMTKAFGLNLARKHVKIEDPRWYYYCDKLGLLVAQDMPSSHNLQSPEAKKNFEHEWREAMEAVRDHPSVILWIPFNENWGDPKEYQDHIVDVTRSVDPSRPIIDAPGWTQRGKTDITDIHDYGNDLKRHAKPHPRRATWIGEYGGVALPVAGHTWVKGWGYQTVKTPDELLAKYKFLTDQINEAPGLSGFIYTQLTDVEQELNGLMTYDRIPKATPERFAEINKK